MALKDLLSEGVEYVQETEPVNPDIGEAWLDTSGNGIIKIFDGSTFIQTGNSSKIQQNIDAPVSGSAKKEDIVEHDIRFVREMSKLFFDRNMNDLNFSDGVYDMFFDSSELSYSSPSPYIDTGVEGFISTGNDLFDASFAEHRETYDFSTNLYSIDWSTDGNIAIYTKSNNQIYSTVGNVSSTVRKQETRSNDQGGRFSSGTFSPDGERLFVVNSSSHQIESYDLDTPFDTSTLDRRDTETFDRNRGGGSANVDIQNVVWADNGNKLLSISGSNVDMYNGSNYDIDVNFDKHVDAPGGVELCVFNDDGTKAIGCDYGDYRLNQYELNTPYDFGDAERVYQTRIRNIEWDDIYGLDTASDGEYLYLTDRDERLAIYKLEDPYDIRTAHLHSYLDNNESPLDRRLYGIGVSNDGTRIAGPSSDERAYGYILEKPHDLSTISPKVDVGVQNNITDAVFTDSDSKILSTCGSTSSVYSQDLNEPGTVSSSTGGEGYFNLSQVLNNNDTYGIEVSSDGGSIYTMDRGSDDIIQADLTEPYDISGEIAGDGSVQKLPLTGYIGGFEYSQDGLTLYILKEDSEIIHQLTLDDPYNINSISTYETFSFENIEERATDITLKNDGTKLYICGRSSGSDATVSSDAIHEFELSTAFDVTSASYTISHRVNSEDSSPTSIEFNTNGTLLIMGGQSSDNVYEYDLSTAWDISTLNYTGTSFNVSQNPYSIEFSPDGSKLILSDSGTIYQWDLSNNYDINSAGNKTNIDPGGPRAIEWESSSFIHVYEYNGEGIGRYKTGNPNDISNLTKVGNNSEDTSLFSVRDQESSPYGFTFNDDGSQLFVVGTSSDSVQRYLLAENYNITTATHQSSFSVQNQESSPSGISFNNDGTRMYIVGTSDDAVNEYALAIGYDISTASHVNRYRGHSDNLYSITFNDDGSKMYTGDDDGQIYEHTLSTPFDTTTASPDDYIDINIDVYGISWADGGNSLFISGQNIDGIIKFDTETPYSLLETYPSGGLSTEEIEPNPTSAKYNNDGSKLFVVGTSSDSVHQYNLSTPFSLSTATKSSSFSVQEQTSNPEGIEFNESGSIMYIASNDDSVYMYYLNTPFEIDSAEYMYKKLDVSSRESGLQDMSWDTDGETLWLCGTGGDSAYRYTSSKNDKRNTSFEKEFNIAFNPDTVIVSDERENDIIVDYEITDINGNTVSIPDDSVGEEVDASNINAGRITLTGTIDSEDIAFSNKLLNFAAYFN